MRTRDDLADRNGSSGISIRRIGGMCERARVAGREEKRKDNAEAQSSQRYAEEEGFTTEDTEEEKSEVGNARG
jgi:hypothetical protein